MNRTLEAASETGTDTGTRNSRTRTWLRLAVVSAAALIALALALVVAPAPPAEGAAALPPGFQDTVVFDGLNQPTAVEFSRDGRVFVAEKSGVIKVFDGLTDSTPTTFADLRTKVHDYWDRGLLGLALDPGFPQDPHVYVLYTHDAAIGGTAPRWGDTCPNPPGANTDGCVVSGRLSRLEAAGDTTTGQENVLIEDWCQQYPSHSIGDLAFGPDGALYVSAGDGASFTFADYGHGGGSSGSPIPKNPCGDPPVPVGGAQTPPTAEGGALRSQDLRTSGDPTGLSGTILRVNPETGAALPDNPLYDSADPNARRIVAYGLRNPFRIAVRPGTNEIWMGEVGWTNWEEINRITNPTGGSVRNFGWPCYEGNGRETSYDNLNLKICKDLYDSPGAATQPFYTYSHSEQVVPGESCPTGGSSPSGVAFYGTGSYPDEYDGGLFFSDFSRNCIWFLREGTNGEPDPSAIKTFVAGAGGPVNLQIGPEGDLFYVDLIGGKIHRIRHFSGNQPPTAVAEADPENGPAPLTVNFDGSGSDDPDPGDTISYAWDLDDDGSFEDSTSPNPTRTYGPGKHVARLRVTDNFGETSTDTVVIGAGAPVATINSPTASTPWKIGKEISFSGSATDQQDGTLSASSLSWSLILHHCASNGTCHEHRIQGFEGVASGSFDGPDHGQPSYLELRLTATDSDGLTDRETVRLDPQTTPLITAPRPSPGSKTGDRTPAIRATVKDLQTNLRKADIKLYVDSRRVKNFAYDRATDRLKYTPDRNLARGETGVTVVALDPEDNRTERRWSFRITR